MNQYSDLFQDYVVSSTSYLVEKVQTSPSRLAASDRRQALHTLSYALGLRHAWFVVKDLLLYMAPKMEQEGFRNEWIPYLEKGIDQSQFLRDRAAEAELSWHLGYLWRLRGVLDTAHVWLIRSRKHFHSLENSRGQAKALNQLAYVSRLQGRYDQASDFLNMALSLLDKDDSERATSFFVQGMIALDEFKWEEAEYAHRKSYEIWQAQNDKRKLAWSLQNRGTALRGQGRYIEAIQCYEQAIVLLEENHDPVNQAIVRMNLGNVYSSQHQSHEALKLYALAEPIFRNVQDEIHLAMVYINMAIDYRKLEKWDEAERICLMSVALSKKLGRERSHLNAMDELGLIYLGQKRYSDAIKTFQSAIKRLSQIKANPGHERLSELLTTHLQEAMEAARDSLSSKEPLADVLATAPIFVISS